VSKWDREMSEVVHVHDMESLRGLAPMAEPSSERVRRYLLGLDEGGVERFVENAHVRMGAVEAGGHLLPMVVAEGVRGDSNVCSPMSHYVEYARREVVSHRKGLGGRTLGGLLGLLGVSLRGLKLDRAVFVNNYLWTTNPWPAGVDAGTVREVNEALVEKYPGHAIVWRSVNPAERPELYDAVVEAGCMMVVSRIVYMIDGRTAGCLDRHDLKLDLGLLRKGDYDVVDGRMFGDTDFRRASELYRGLYIDKYTPLNPQFTEAYWEMVQRAGTMEFVGLKREGALKGFVSWLEEDGVMLGTGIGYDLSAPRKDGLYRRLIAMYIKRALEKKMLLNLSGGAGKFKRLRGGQAATEYNAVYAAHLGMHRRLAWRTVRGVFRESLVRKFEE
jgi:hypothetical protein